MLGRTFGKLGEWLQNTEAEPPPEDTASDRRPLNRVIPSLPRPITFARQNSERRERLEPHDLDPEERRATAVDKRLRSYIGSRVRANSSVPTSEKDHDLSELESLALANTNLDLAEGGIQDNILGETGSLFPFPGPQPSELREDLETVSEALEDLNIQDELETKWILNLSMHFRDKSEREKFFITWIEKPNKWRRITVSCDYREVASDSLEAEIKSLYYQRDKSAKVYESLRDSLPEIQFFPTVTNLKLQTTDGKLHVHVTEDINELITYPELSLLPYIDCPRYRESQVDFESHLSGFVYQVKIGDRSYIKKEIPGPDAVDEFLYEINALSSLSHSHYVIPFEGIVVDESKQMIRGLVISYAENGALVDLLYDLKDTDMLPWSRRERWAKQIVQGLSDIHEAGFVQGDFTLSNVVIDEHDNARIIDINRRGCPVGWEPPEMTKMIEAGQKISMYIGVKTDLFQLAMVLWGLAEVHDEPERVARPLKPSRKWDNLPGYYKRIFEICYANDPRDRKSAKEILEMFPPEAGQVHVDQHNRRNVEDEGRSPEPPPSLQLAAGANVNTAQDFGGSNRIPTASSAAFRRPGHIDSGFDEAMPVDMDRHSLMDSIDDDFSERSNSVPG